MGMSLRRYVASSGEPSSQPPGASDSTGRWSPSEATQAPATNPRRSVHSESACPTVRRCPNCGGLPPFAPIIELHPARATSSASLTLTTDQVLDAQRLTVLGILLGAWTDGRLVARLCDWRMVGRWCRAGGWPGDAIRTCACLPAGAHTALARVGCGLGYRAAELTPSGSTKRCNRARLGPARSLIGVASNGSIDSAAVDVTTAVIALVVGFGGVVLGALLTRRNERRSRADALLAQALSDAVAAISEVGRYSPCLCIGRKEVLDAALDVLQTSLRGAGAWGHVLGCPGHVRGRADPRGGRR